MDDAFRDALAIEVRELLHEVIVLVAGPRAPTERVFWLSGTG
jgi:hypothetical protein